MILKLRISESPEMLVKNVGSGISLSSFHSLDLENDSTCLIGILCYPDADDQGAIFGDMLI